MKYAEWIESLTIFAKYEPEGLDTVVWPCAEHDEMWMGPDPKLVSDEDKTRLAELHWTATSEDTFHRFV